MKELKPEKIVLGNLVCFRHGGSAHNFERSKWILLCPWTAELREAYIFVHSEPYNSEKGNREPIFQEAIYESVPLCLQTPGNVLAVYRNAERRRRDETGREPFRTKIIDCRLLYDLGEI